MPRGRRRKIEVPADSQSQFELRGTAEDIERRRERVGREERERQEQVERESERLERERTEGTEQIEETDRKATLNGHRYRSRMHSIQGKEGANEVDISE